MEHDTSDQSSSDVHHGNTWQHQSLLLQSNRHDTSTLEKSMPNLQIDNNTINRINNTTISVADKHNISIIDDDELINARSSPDMISDTRCAQSPSDDSPPAPSMPLALSDEAMLPQLRISPRNDTPFPLPLSTTTLSTDGRSSRLFDGSRNGDMFDGSNRNQDDGLHIQINKEMVGLIPSHYDEDAPSTIHDTLIHESISNSKCIPVEGKLADLSDNESPYSRDEDDEEEGGIVILDESKEEDDESIHTSIENGNQCILESQVHNSQTSSMWEHDTILLDETSRMNTNLLSLDANNNSNNRNESLTDFEQLLNQAGDNAHQVLLQEIEEDVDDEQSENDRDESSTAASGMQFWQLNPFSSSNRNKKEDIINTATTPSSRHNTPIRSTRIRHDKFVIEVDISDDNNTRLDVRDVLDIMANIELLHLWFDPVPAVFETLIKDGSEAPDNSTSIEEDNDHNQLENNHNREYDGQWVEISTPPLIIPSDSRVSGCMRAIRVGMRSLIGFPARIKSMIFVERSCGRIGMTLGPYPDGYLCTSGTTAYHTFTIRQRDDEESNNSIRQCVVISDEVRLQRGVDSDFNGTVRSCCVCTFVRFIFGFLNVLFRWYQPDLASYMQQTISSMEKLRSLVERGESAAYSSGGEMIIDGSHDSEVRKVDETPLLGN